MSSSVANIKPSLNKAPLRLWISIFFLEFIINNRRFYVIINTFISGQAFESIL